MEKRIQQICNLLPLEVGQAVAELPLERQGSLEEIRLRIGCEVTAVSAGVEEALSVRRPLICTHAMLEQLVNTSCGYSAYAAEETLRQGYLPLQGGHRLGLCGTAVMDGARIITLKEISSANLRVARQLTGCAEELAKYLAGHPVNTLIFGPPGSGKTTLLRDLVRQLSDRYGWRMGLVDSRGELAACLGGRPQLAVGRRTDVVSRMPKAEAMELLLRTMNPQWIAVDEITAAEDVAAMDRSAYCGVGLLATAHGNGREDLKQRPLYRQLLEREIFQSLVILDRKKVFRVERMGEHG